MSINKFQLFIFIVCLQFTQTVSAQSTYQFGALPLVNLNAKLKSNWSLNAKIESRQLFQSGEFNGSIHNKYKYVLTDFTLIAAKKIGLNSRLAGGYLIRFKEGIFVHRLIQQYIIIQNTTNLRLAHRFLSDQTFSNNEKPTFRLRYRLSTEIPLSGESVDPREFYLKLNHEYLNSLKDSEYDLEIRFVPMLGYSITNKYKLEFGLDYRVNSFLNNIPRHSFWTSLKFYVEI